MSSAIFKILNRPIFLAPTGALFVSCLGALGAQHASKQASPPDRTVLSARLPANMNGKNLRANLLIVNYAPGQASPPHTHACPVIVYVLEGSVRSKIGDQPQTVYQTGESFYEPPGAVHSISANASDSEPAKFLAFFVCDRKVPLSRDLPQFSVHPKSGGEQ